LLCGQEDVGGERQYCGLQFRLIESVNCTGSRSVET
jgi:hypothetical protein